MLKIYICEDEHRQLLKLKNIIQNNIFMQAYDMELSIITPNPYEIINELKKTSFTGIYFLDIDLKSKLNGFDLAESIRKYDPRGFIIFITAKINMLPLTFKYKCEAMDYIIKAPETNMGVRIAECLNEANARFSVQNSSVNKVFSFKFGDTIINEEFNNIVLIETNAENPHKLSMYAIGRALDFRESLKEVEKKLDKRFMKCSGSCIINTDMVENVDKKSRIITLKTGQTVSVSTRSIKSLLERIEL